VPEALPDYRVTARNTSAESENKIHDDTVARRYGFRGGLVPGVTVYAYLTQPLVAALGTGWLDRGTATVRFGRPIFEGEEVRVAGEITERTPQAVSATVRAFTDASGECAMLAATVPAGTPTPINVSLYRRAALPHERPAVSREHFLSLDALGTPVVRYDEGEAAAYVERVADSLAIYRGRGGRVHPAFYLHQANRALSQNVTLGPWIHVSSAVRHLGAAYVGDTLEVRGRVRSVYEKKERDYVELDLVVLAGERRPIAHVLHTAIYRLVDVMRGPDMAPQSPPRSEPSRDTRDGPRQAGSFNAL
jgi:acyl dehydratase